MRKVTTLTAVFLTASVLAGCGWFGMGDDTEASAGRGGYALGNSPISWFDDRVIPTAGMSSGAGEQQSMSGEATGDDMGTGEEMAEPAAGTPMTDTTGWPLRTANTSSGEVLVDEAGMTLYTFDNDADGRSMCVGECATKWPPVMAADNAQNAGDFTIVTREDGSRQWAYKGRPLYRWYEDRQAGDVTGDNVGGVWHLATP